MEKAGAVDDAARLSENPFLRNLLRELENGIRACQPGSLQGRRQAPRHPVMLLVSLELIITSDAFQKYVRMYACLSGKGVLGSSPAINSAFIAYKNTIEHDKVLWGRAPKKHPIEFNNTSVTE